MANQKILAIPNASRRVMTTLLCCGGVGLLILLGVSLGHGLRRAPKLSLESEILRLTGLTEGRNQSFSVSYRNAGRKPLLVELAHVSCSCVSVQLSHSELIPGSEGQLTGTLSPKPSSEAVLATIQLKTNDPDRPVSEIIIEGDLGPTLLVKPQQLSIYPDPNRPGTQRAPLTVLNQTEEQVHVFEILAKDVDVRVSKTDFVLGPYEKTVIDVEVDPSALLRQRGQLLIRAERPARRVSPVDVNVLPWRPVNVSPRKFQFGMLDPSEIQQRTAVLLLTGDGLSDIEISDIQVPAFMKLHERHWDDRKRILSISFRFCSDVSLGLNEGVVRLNLEDRRLSNQRFIAREINIPVSAIVTSTLASDHH